MAVMTRWDAFHDLRAAQDQMSFLNRMFGQVFGQDLQQTGTGTTTVPAWAPAVDIWERKDAFVVTVELPGVTVADLEIAFQDGLLTIQGERRPVAGSADERIHLCERRYGLFRRSITLPQQVKTAAIEATTEDGVLRIVVPKAEEAKATRIEVRTSRAPAPVLTGAPHTTNN